MNIQAIMKQAQKMQKDVMNAKEELNKKIFIEENSYVHLEMNGKKELTKISINKEMNLSIEDVEMLEDILLVAINNLNKQIDDETEKQLGKYGQGMSGLI